MTALPPEAVTVVADLLENDNWSTNSDELAKAIVEAVEPLIRAAERERIRQLAIKHQAYATEEYPYQRDTLFPFATLLSDTS